MVYYVVTVTSCMIEAQCSLSPLLVAPQINVYPWAIPESVCHRQLRYKVSYDFLLLFGFTCRHKHRGFWVDGYAVLIADLDNFKHVHSVCNDELELVIMVQQVGLEYVVLGVELIGASVD